MLNFISKSVLGCTRSAQKDVVVNTKGKTAYTISFCVEKLKEICGGNVPEAMMIAESNNKLYFVPSNNVSIMSFAVNQYKKTDSRCNIQISKKRANLDKFEGAYNLHFDDTENAYCIDRKFLLG